MAIQKSKTLANGAQGNYWRLLSVTFNREALSVVGVIALFKDKATSDAGKPHLGFVKSFNFSFNMAEVAAITNPVSYIYTKILDKANTVVSMDILGHAVDPHAFDEDIAGGTSV